MLIKIIRPYVILNVAVTADGKTDTYKREAASISSTEDMHRVDQLRASVDAILVGGRTLMENDPRLTIKSAELQEQRIRQGLTPNPTKIGVITQAELAPGCRFLIFGPAEKMIFTTRQTSQEQINGLEKLGASVFIMGDERVDLIEMMHQLWQAGIRRVLVEGGGTLNSELLRLQLVDKINIYLAPMIFGGKTAPTFVDGLGFNSEEAVRLKLSGIEQLTGDGIVLHYLPIYEESTSSTQ
ncbi:MAG: 2,5-diamino-6-(ribosylamino)-4(3H)-pyrimidinone 5'-phosphate reductase [Anaerolineales bacterium]|nr:2,5-diamino-6-(ribosylamino)-4(3H)-pyrimidinone 5'-phosphate reductase [Anaerolineae bacterium]PWB51529.1 MAG: 2,5-diamino-6-(ribosylamino)-4(3H)-pyrimidinone 5'-phosphate reductase [Anaerolineales bacterium]